MSSLLIEVEVETTYELNLKAFNPQIEAKFNNHLEKGKSLLRDSSKQNEAIDEFNLAINSDPSRHEAHLMKGMCLAKLGKYLEAIECYDIILEVDSENVTALNEKAYALYSVKRYSESEAIFTKANDLNSELYSAESFMNKGISMVGLKRFREAVLFFLKCIELDSENEFAYYRLANCYALSENDEQAIENYKKAIKLNPNFVNAFNNIGVSLAHYSELKNGLVYFDKTLEKDKNHLNSLYNKSLIEAELGNYKEALESIENLIEINSNDCDAYIMKANVLNGLKKFGDSIEWCNKAIRIDSNKPEVFIIKGIAKTKMNRLDEALQCFQSAIDLNKNFKLAIKYKKQILKYLKK